VQDWWKHRNGPPREA